MLVVLGVGIALMSSPEKGFSRGSKLESVESGKSGSGSSGTVMDGTIVRRYAVCQEAQEGYRAFLRAHQEILNSSACSQCEVARKLLFALRTRVHEHTVLGGDCGGDYAAERSNEIVRRIRRLEENTASCETALQEHIRTLPNIYQECSNEFFGQFSFNITRDITESNCRPTDRLSETIMIDDYR